MSCFIQRLLAVLIGLCGYSMPNAQGAASFESRSWKINPSKSIPYRLFVPKNRVAGRKYPVMLALHGAGERGSNNTSQLNHAFTTLWADDSIQRENPCFVVAPQCPLNEQWVVSPPPWDNYDFTRNPITDNLKAVMSILDTLEKEFPIDKDREYISGMSMGGQGTWYALMAFPARFAAAVPVCGSSDPAQAPNLDRIPIWTFHALDDNVVFPRTTQATVRAIRAIGGTRLKYTEYAANLGIGHESWKPAGRDPALHRWVFSKVRESSTVVRPLRARIIPSILNASKADLLGRCRARQGRLIIFRG